MVLKYQGSFQQMVSGSFFHYSRQNPWYRAQASFPFYFLLAISGEDDKKELIKQYLWNNVSTLKLIQYDQSSPRDAKLTLNCSWTYAKFNYIVSNPADGSKDKSRDKRDPLGNLLCIGSPGAGKSYLLNEIFRTGFDIHDPDALGLYHDSVDVTFRSDDLVPLKFNLFDVQGATANEDWVLIADLLNHLPFCFLLVQVNDEDYVEKLWEQVFEGKKFEGKPLWNKFRERTVFISRHREDFDDIEAVILDKFENMPHKHQILNIGD